MTINKKLTGAHCAPLQILLLLITRAFGKRPYIQLHIERADNIRPYNYALITKNLLNRLLLLNFIETLAIHSKL